MEVYRAPMRSRRDDIAPFAGVDRGLALSVCGIGGRLDQPPADLLGALVRVEDEYDERAAARLRRWAAAPVGAEVWTRDGERSFHRGTLTGPWYYDTSAAAHLVDLVHVRACTWRRARPDRVPPAVEETFRRGGRNLQRIAAL